MDSVKSGKKKGCCVPWIELGRKWIGIDKPLHRHPNAIFSLFSQSILGKRRNENKV